MYRQDLNRAAALLLEHVQSDEYDGIALVLKPICPNLEPAFVVAGIYRHKLAEAADATIQLHLQIKIRALQQAGATPSPPHTDARS